MVTCDEKPSNLTSHHTKCHREFYQIAILLRTVRTSQQGHTHDGPIRMAYLVERGTCDPKVGHWNENRGFVICSSVVPFGFASGVQLFPWYRWGSERDSDMPHIVVGGEEEDNMNVSVSFIHHGYRGSWVGMDKALIRNKLGILLIGSISYIVIIITPSGGSIILLGGGASKCAFSPLWCSRRSWLLR
jgi:hypothetical protein